MKKIIALALLLLLPLCMNYAQKRKQRIANEQTAAWRYELQNEAVGNEQTVLVKVWSYSKNVAVARNQSLKNAVHGLIFKGAAGNSDTEKRTKPLPPLVSQPDAETIYARFFDPFFADGGDYQRYATLASSGEAGSVQKIGKEYRVATYVTVQYAALRRMLEAKGLIDSMQEVVTGKQPTIMVVPSDNWCIQQGFFTEVDNQGTIERIPDYGRALQEDPNLLLVISKIGELMADRGFPLVDLEASLKRIREEDAEQMLTTSKGTGAELAETPLERLSRTAKADIWMQVTWSMNHMGPKTSITFNLQGKDAYSDKQIAASSGTCPPTFDSAIELPVFLAEHVAANINPFNQQLMAFFNDIMENGREIRISCRRWDDWEYDFESEFDGEELADIIEEIVAENCHNGKYGSPAISENRMDFTQVRIPITDQKGRDLDARNFVKVIRKTLKEKYMIESKLIGKGLGQAILILGGK